MTRIVSIAVVLALTSGANAQQTLVYVPDGSCTTRGGFTPLDRLEDETICEFTPFAGGPTAANKIVSLGNWNAIHGDDDADGEFFQDSLGEVDAMALHPKFVPNPFGNPELFDYVFSSENDFGSSWATPISAGTLWRLVKGTVPGGPVVTVFLDEAVLKAGVGTTSSVNVDALAFDAVGTMYLSFSDDELIHGDAVPLLDGSIIAFPPPLISYDLAGNITSLGSDTVQVVLNEADVDIFVGATGIYDVIGLPITVVGDVLALDADPNGGVFLGADGVTLWPNLFFSGEGTGPRILTTAGGGNIGILNGMPLGDPFPIGGFVGLDGLGSDIASIQVIPFRDDPLCVDLEGQGLDALDLTDMMWIGNGVPFGVALVAASVGTSAPGDNFASLKLGKKYRFPSLYATPWFALLPVPLDPLGRFPLPIGLPPGLIGDLNILVQVFDITFAPVELSAPIVIAYDG